MKRNRYILLIVAMLTLLAGCNKWDCNGDLDGMWQLTEWRTADGAVKATKEDMIFYCFQLKMASIQKKKGNGSVVHKTSMKMTPDVITIYDPIEYIGGGHDEIRPMADLADLGVPADGIFHIEVLTGSKMQLRTNPGDILLFRKY